MKYMNAKLITLIVILLGVSILIGIAVYNKQSKLSSPMAYLLTQTPSTKSTIPPTPTFVPPSAAELGNFFGDASCSWPCWQGIIPGVTTSSEALKKLQESVLITKSTLQSEEVNVGFGNAHWQWKIGDRQQAFGGYMEWRGGLVWQINLTTYPVISLGEMIDRFGSPEKIDVINCSEIVESPPVFCAVLYYAKNGFEIHIGWESSAHGEDIQVTPTDPIDAVILFEPSTLEEWLSSNNDFGIQSLNLQDWKGYGNLFDLYY